MRMENPLQGRFNRERTVLTFSQRSLEARAAFWSVIGGSAAFVIGLAMNLGYSWWLMIFGTLFALAGGWAYLLFRSIRFDLRKRTYVERFGSGMWVKWRTGSIDEVNCLGLERYHGLIPEMQLGQGGWTAGGTHVLQRPGQFAGSVFVVRLWWKDRGRYPPVIEHLHANVLSAGPDAGAATFHALAQSYAHALKVPLYGNLS